MHDIHTIETQEQTITATACEQAALFGATPGPDEFDSRVVWDEKEATSAVTKAFHVLAQAAPDGTQLADERANLLWGFVNTLDAQTRRLDRAADRLIPGIRELQRKQDGSEIRSRELELTTDRAQNFNDRRDAFEQLRDVAAEAYRVETGEVWRPRRGSHTSQTGKLTSAMIDARDFQRARKDRENTAHLPQGTLVAVAGGKEAADVAAIIGHLNKLKVKYQDVVLVHGGGPGAEKIAGGLGGAERRPPGRLQARLGRTRTGGALQAQRRTARPPPQGRHRVPGLRHHRQPRRQGQQARHPRPARRGLSRTHGSRRYPAARPFFLARIPAPLPTLPPPAPSRPRTESATRVPRVASDPLYGPPYNTSPALLHSLRPLSRRGGSRPPLSPASIPPSFVPQVPVLLTPFGGSFCHTRRSGLHRLQRLRMTAISCARLLRFIPTCTTVVPKKVRRICDEPLILITISTG